MALGGIFEESKLSVYHRIPKGWTPKTLALPPFIEKDALEQFMAQNQLSFPVIVKPDRGMRGRGVRYHKHMDTLIEHASSFGSGHPHIIQPYIDMPMEIGVFMIKDGADWSITSLVQRELPKVIGNGTSSIIELISRDDHLFLQLERIKKYGHHQLNRVPVLGEEVKLGLIGNHRLGTHFLDRNDLISEEFKMAMKRICDLLKGFEYGRLDIRFNNWDSFEELRDFSIIEVNGANSEPGHIYQQGFDLVGAWKVLLKHHRIIFQKAKKAQANGQSGPDFIKSATLFRQYLRTMKVS